MLKKFKMLEGGILMSKKSLIAKIVLTGVLTTMIMFAMMLPAYCDGANIIKNPGFEDGAAGDVWSGNAFDKKDGSTDFKLEEGQGHSGTKFYSITNNQPNDSKVIQEVSIESEKIYKVDCWIKAESIKDQAGSANISIYNDIGIYTSQELKDTAGQWQQLEFYVKTTKEIGSTVKFALRLGGQGTLNQGKASFDDLSMVEVDSAPAGVQVASFFIPSESGSSGGDAGQGGSSGSGLSKTLIYVVIGIIIVGLLVFIEIKFAKRGKKEEGSEESAAGTEYEEEDNSDDSYVEYSDDEDK